MVCNKINLAIIVNITILLLLGMLYSINTKYYSDKKFKIISIISSFLCTGIVAILPI